MESGQARCWAHCAARLAGWKKNLSQKYPIKEMKTLGVVSFSVTATLLTGSNEKWVGRPRYLYWSEWVVYTDQVCHSSNLWEDRGNGVKGGVREQKKNFQFVPYRKWQPRLCLVWQSSSKCRFSTHKNTFCIFFFCACTTKETSLEMTLADDTVWWVTAKCKRLSSVVNDGFLLNCIEVHINQWLRCRVVPAGFPL